MPARIPMTAPQRTALLALPDTEELVLRFHHLDEEDLAAIATARMGNVTPADTYFGRAAAIIRQRERIKRKTIEHRRLQHRRIAA